VRAAGVKFAFLKATQGTDITDSRYARNVQSARAQGISVGSYHFFDYRKSGRDQADLFVATMISNGGLAESLPAVVDVECLRSYGPADHASARTELRAFTDRVEELTGRRVMVYTGRGAWRQVTGDSSSFGDLSLWVACWSCSRGPLMPVGWDEWLFWQIGSQRIPGVGRIGESIHGGTDQQVTDLRSERIAIEGGRPFTNRTDVSVAVSATSDDSIAVAVDMQPFGDWLPGAPTISVDLSGDDGLRTVRVRNRDDADQTEAGMADTIVLDRAAPLTSRPSVRLVKGAASTDLQRVPVLITWSARDPVSGLSGVGAWYDCGDGQAPLASSFATGAKQVSGSLTHTVSVDAACTGGVTATDRAGNVTDRLTAGSATSIGIRTGATITPGGRHNLSFDGAGVSLIVTRGPSAGRVGIVIDGVRVAILDLYAARTLAAQVVFAKGLSAGHHTISIRSLAATKRGKRGGAIIDGFAILQRP